MKTIVTTPDVDMSLRTLGPDERRRVHAWFDHLANWDNDSFVRQNSHPLDGIPGVRVLRTSGDLRIFFKMEGDTITIEMVAYRDAILAVAN